MSRMGSRKSTNYDKDGKMHADPGMNVEAAPTTDEIVVCEEVDVCEKVDVCEEARKQRVVAFDLPLTPQVSFSSESSASSEWEEHQNAERVYEQQEEVARESAFQRLLDESLQHDADSTTLLVKSLVVWLYSLIVAAFGGFFVSTTRISIEHPAWWLFLTTTPALKSAESAQRLPPPPPPPRKRLVEVDVGDMAMTLTELQ